MPGRCKVTSRASPKSGRFEYLSVPVTNICNHPLYYLGNLEHRRSCGNRSKDRISADFQATLGMLSLAVNNHMTYLNFE